jgi:hypothetical protein
MNCKFNKVSEGSSKKGRSTQHSSMAWRRAFWATVRQTVLLLAIGLTVFAGSSLAAIAASPRDVPTTDLPCMLAPGAQGVVVLFSGKAEELAQNFTHQDGTAPTWKIIDDGSLQAQDADIMTKQGFGDCQLHVEFKIPLMADAAGQARGNSGIILHGRFEMQILDSYGISQPGTGDCGAVYNVQAPLVNACKAPNEWQSYDIIFRAAHFAADGKTRLQAACVTAFLNGALVQNNTEIPGPTGDLKIGDPGKPAPFLLQYHGSAVEFRNIWILPLSPMAAGEAPAPEADLAKGPGVLTWQDVKEGEQVPVERVLFDQGGYQVHCGNGETIAVPFANENLNVMKFGRSTTDNAYFVNDGSTPTLYLSNGSNAGYLESAVAEDTKWYPFTNGYNYSSPVYVGLAPTWRDYTTMGWYPGMEVYGGVLSSTRGASTIWMPGYYTSINGTSYPSYIAYRRYLAKKPTYARNRVVFVNYPIRPTGPRSIVNGNPVNGGTRSGRPVSPHIPHLTPPHVRPVPPQIQRSAQRVPPAPLFVRPQPGIRTSSPARPMYPGSGGRVIRPPAPVIRPPAPVIRPPAPVIRRPVPAPPRYVPPRRHR